MSKEFYLTRKNKPEQLLRTWISQYEEAFDTLKQLSQGTPTNRYFIKAVQQRTLIFDASGIKAFKVPLISEKCLEIYPKKRFTYDHMMFNGRSVSTYIILQKIKSGMDKLEILPYFIAASQQIAVSNEENNNLLMTCKNYTLQEKIDTPFENTYVKTNVILKGIEGNMFKKPNSEYIVNIEKEKWSQYLYIYIDNNKIIFPVYNEFFELIYKNYGLKYE